MLSERQVVWGVGTELGERTGLGDELLWMQSDWGFEYHAEESGLRCIGDWEPLKVDWVLACAEIVFFPGLWHIWRMKVGRYGLFG